MDATDAEKKRLRAEFRTRRQALSDDAYAARSAALVARLLALPEVAAASSVHVYWPLVARREPDLRPLVAALHARGVTLAMPFVAAVDPPTMTHRRLRPGAPVAPDAAGIPTAGGDEVDAAAFDVVVVPALAVDWRGVRLGYGKGFYDRFLAQTRAFAVCPIFSDLFVETLPAGPRDVPVGCVVTEEETFRVPAATAAALGPGDPHVRS